MKAIHGFNMETANALSKIRKKDMSVTHVPKNVTDGEQCLYFQPVFKAASCLNQKESPQPLGQNVAMEVPQSCCVSAHHVVIWTWSFIIYIWKSKITLSFHPESVALVLYNRTGCDRVNVVHLCGIGQFKSTHWTTVVYTHKTGTWERVINVTSEV